MDPILSPCPFCSNPATRLLKMSSDQHAGYCPGCHALGHISTYKEAIAAWNRRSVDPKSDDLRSRIVEWIESLKSAPYKSSEHYAATILENLIN